MTLPACLYLHGFLSSPDSLKAQQVASFYHQHECSARLRIPFLAFEPEVAIAQAEQQLQELMQAYGEEHVLVIGSSLGGYYATWLAQQYSVRAALINPAVRPFELLTDYLGPNTHFHTGQVHELSNAHMKQLEQLYCPHLTAPHRFFLLLQTGDETLDYRQAANYYQGCPAWLEGGGDHSFTHFEQRLPMLMQFSRR